MNYCIIKKSILAFLATTILFLQATVVAALPIEHLSKPTVYWNARIDTESPPGRRNAVQLSPDDAWLYVTSDDGTLSKLDPENGDYRAAYVPEPRQDVLEDGSVSEWVSYGGEGIVFHMDDDDSGVGDYLVYWMFDVSSQSDPSTRVIAIEHDPNSAALKVLWTKVLTGTISGMPVIGSEGKFIYFTMNSPAQQSVVASPPTTSPVAAPVVVATNAPVTSVSGTPTISPVATANTPATNNVTVATNSPVATNATSLINTPTITPITWVNDTTTGNPNNIFNNTESDETLDLLTKPAYWWAEEGVDGNLTCVENADYPDQYLTNGTLWADNLFISFAICCVKNAVACAPKREREHLDPVVPENTDRRNLQSTARSGKFVILSHPQSGELIYEFDSRDELSIQKHNFAPVGIAHKPEYGNYNGGQDNTNDVIMWGSQKGFDADARQGETILFQLPEDFDFTEMPVDISQFQPRFLESVSWTTSVRPTFSESGLDVYFTITGNSITGWNKGQKFDVVANLGPIPLPPELDNTDTGAFRPIVMADNDKLLLVGSTDHDYMFATLSSSGGIKWLMEEMGTGSVFTTPRVSTDGEIVYFGKKSAVHAVNLTDGTQIWGEDGFQHPSSIASDVVLADFSLSSTGEYLYYSRSGSSISAIKVAELIPTMAPITPTSTPSAKPSLVSSSSPSESMMPSASTHPTMTTPPTIAIDPDRPSSPPTSSFRPSASPVESPSASPTSMSSNVPSSPPTVTTPTTKSPVRTLKPTLATTLAPVTASPVISDATVPKAPSSSPVATPPSANPPSAAIESGDNTKEEISGLSTTAIIGIAAGAGIALILIIGLVYYANKKRSGDDDGVDTDWQQSNNANATAGAEEGTTFQYGGEEGNQQWAGEGGESNLQW